MEPHVDGPAAIVFRPIAFFRSDAQYSYEVPRQASFADPSVGQVEFLPLPGLDQCLDQIETFSHLWLIFQFHQNHHWRPKVRPPRGTDRKVGVFATRSPYRPNPIGMSSVELVRRHNCCLWVRHFDLLDGTPILDIKPYIPAADSHPQANSGWLPNIAVQSLIWEPLAKRQCQWIEEKTRRKLSQFITQQLECNPFDQRRKRVTILASAEQPVKSGLLAFRTWRCLFTQTDSTSVKVHRFFSAYTPAELSDSLDPYNDKDVHRLFIQDFGPTTLWPEVRPEISFVPGER